MWEGGRGLTTRLLGAGTTMAAETERAGVKGLGTWIDKHKDRITFIIAILAILISVFSLVEGRCTDRMNRLLQEVQRLYSTEFSNGLSELLVYSHEFIGRNPVLASEPSSVITSSVKVTGTIVECWLSLGS